MEKSSLSFRPIEPKDSDLLLKWRNDPETRRQSARREPVNEGEHKTWLSGVFGNPSLKIYMCLADGKCVGTFRLDSRRQGTEVSWTVAPEYRGRGLGRDIVALAANLARAARREEHPLPIWARIRPENIGSIKAARAAGFKKTGEEASMEIWQWLP